MEKIKKILNEVLEEIQPGKNYEAEIFDKLNSIIKKINKSQKYARALLGGSGAKGTWLKAFDADIFVLFNYKKFKDKSDKLSDFLEKILKKNFNKIIRLHGSRDYFQIKQNNFTFEIVPILDIKRAEQAKNITDVSPLHSKWVTKHRKLANEMKLTKQFCQAQNVYGAESYIRGFSGYVCEILTVYYGSFLNLARKAARWQDKVIIDVENYYRRKDIFKLINTSKLASPLIVIDPVQRDRNASAALGIEKFEQFKMAAKLFLKNPSKKFFYQQDLWKVYTQAADSKNYKFLKIKVDTLSGKIDVVGSKLMKVFEYIKKEFENHEFNIIRSDLEWDKNTSANLYFLFSKNPFGKNVEIEGPPLRLESHVKRFKGIHKKTFKRSGKIFALEQRRFVVPEDLLKEVIKNQYVRERTKSVIY